VPSFQETVDFVRGIPNTLFSMAAFAAAWALLTFDGGCLSVRKPFFNFLLVVVPPIIFSTSRNGCDCCCCCCWDPFSTRFGIGSPPPVVVVSRSDEKLLEAVLARIALFGDLSLVLGKFELGALCIVCFVLFFCGLPIRLSLDRLPPPDFEEGTSSLFFVDASIASRTRCSPPFAVLSPCRRVFDLLLFNGDAVLLVRLQPEAMEVLVSFDPPFVILDDDSAVRVCCCCCCFMVMVDDLVDRLLFLVDFLDAVDVVVVVVESSFALYSSRFAGS